VISGGWSCGDGFFLSCQRLVPGILHIRHATAIRFFTSCQRFVPGIRHILPEIRSGDPSYQACHSHPLFYILPEIRSGDPSNPARDTFRDPSHPTRDSFRGSFISGMPQPSALSYPARDSFRGLYCLRYVPGIHHILPEIRSGD